MSASEYTPPPMPPLCIRRVSSAPPPTKALPVPPSKFYRDLTTVSHRRQMVARIRSAYGAFFLPVIVRVGDDGVEYKLMVEGKVLVRELALKWAAVNPMPDAESYVCRLLDADDRSEIDPSTAISTLWDRWRSPADGILYLVWFRQQT